MPASHSHTSQDMFLRGAMLAIEDLRQVRRRPIIGMPAARPETIYAIGLAFSEGDTWLLLDEGDGGWSVADWAELTFGVPPSW
jgi:hypothetical protein